MERLDREPSIALPGAAPEERRLNAKSAQGQQDAQAEVCNNAKLIVKTMLDLLIDPAAKIRLGAATVLLGKLLPDKMQFNGDALDQLSDKELQSIIKGELSLGEILGSKSHAKAHKDASGN